MSDDFDDVLQIARDEAEETSQSIVNLDNISDTAVVGITFLLAALGTWVGFVYKNVASAGDLRIAFVVIAISSVVFIALSMYYFVEALSPRKFYGGDVGNRFLTHRWLLWRDDDTAGVGAFERQGDIDSPQDLRVAVENWIEHYDGETTIDSEEAFVYSRLLNYKLVARKKARLTAYGMAFLRLAVVSLGTLVVVGLISTLF